VAQKLKHTLSVKLVQQVVKKHANAERPKISGEIVLRDVFPKHEDRLYFRDRLTKQLGNMGFKILLKHIPITAEVTLGKISKAVTIYSLPTAKLPGSLDRGMSGLPGEITIPRPKKKKRDSDS
jgi:hypothetical protein